MPKFGKSKRTYSQRLSARLESLENRNLLAGDAFEAVAQGIPTEEVAGPLDLLFELEGLPNFEVGGLPDLDLGDMFFDMGDMFFGGPMWFVETGFLPELDGDFSFDSALDFGEAHFEGELPNGSGGEFGFDFGFGDAIDVAEGDLLSGITVGNDGELFFAVGFDPWGGVELFDVEPLEGEFGNHSDPFFMDLFCPVGEDGFEFPSDEIEGELPDGVSIGEDGELLFEDGFEWPKLEIIEGELPDGVSIGEDGEILFEDGFEWPKLEIIEGELPDGVSIGGDGEILFEDGFEWPALEVVDADFGFSDLWFHDECLVELSDDILLPPDGDGESSEVDGAEEAANDGLESSPTHDICIYDLSDDMIFLPDFGFDMDFEDGDPAFADAMSVDNFIFWPGMNLPIDSGPDNFFDVIDIDHGHSSEVPSSPEIVDVPVREVSPATEVETSTESTAATKSAAFTAPRTDFNRDGNTNFADFLHLSSVYGQEVDAAFADADVTGDGIVNFGDFLVFAAALPG